MRTKGVVGVVLSFSLAFALMSGSGIGPAVFGEDPGGAEVSGVVEDASEDASLDEDDGGLIADIAGDDEPSIVGLVLSTGAFLTSLLVSVALLPVTLMRLGFPTYAAVPLGGIAQILAFIGLAQFLTGREVL